MAAPELGVRAELTGGLLPMTRFREAPITVHWFEPDPRDAGLWDLRRRFGDRIGPFVDAVAAALQEAGTGRRPFDSDARARVEALCEQAREAVEAGRVREAREILSRAAALNGSARSPLVYQYMANLAVMTGDLLAALPAQKEALRLAPGNRLHAENLKRLLKQPWTEATAARPASPRGEVSGSGG
jgi:tetratricopeptide (TPR) repeat protein